MISCRKCGADVFSCGCAPLPCTKAVVEKIINDSLTLRSYSMPTITCMKCRGRGVLPTSATNTPKLAPVCPDCQGRGVITTR